MWKWKNHIIFLEVKCLFSFLQPNVFEHFIYFRPLIHHSHILFLILPCHAVVWIGRKLISIYCNTNWYLCLFFNQISLSDYKGCIKIIHLENKLFRILDRLFTSNNYIPLIKAINKIGLSQKPARIGMITMLGFFWVF